MPFQNFGENTFDSLAISSDILSEFSSEIKPRNFAFSIGIDFLKNSFSYKKLRNDILKILNKSNFAKDIFFNIANKGFRF